MARFLDSRGRAAEREAQQFEKFYERASNRIYAENRNAIATFRDEALAEVNAADAGNPHAWALAESAASHATEMLWRNKQNLVDIADSGKTGTFTDDERKAAVVRSRLHYKNDPLYIRAINLTAAFIYGVGVSMPKPARDLAGSQPEDDGDEAPETENRPKGKRSLTELEKQVNTLVQDFWHDDINLRYLTGNAAQIQLCRRFLKDGEIPLILGLDSYRIVPVDCLDIVEVKEHGSLAGMPMLYKRQEGPGRFRWYWSIEAEMFKADPSFEIERTRLQTDLGATPDDKAVMMLWKYGDGLRGYPPFFSALDWGAANTLLAGNLQSYVKSVTAIVGKYKGKMTATDIARVKNEVASNLSRTNGLPPPTGSVRVEGEGGAEYSLLNVPTGGAEIFKTGFEVSRLMVSAATGIPIHWLGDPSTGNLATATAMELAQLKDFTGWQQWFIGCYDNLFRALARLDGITTDTARFIEIDFPDLTQDEFASKSAGLAALKASGGMSDEDFARQVAYLCQSDDVEAWVQRATEEADSAEATITQMVEHNPMRAVATFRKAANNIEAKVKASER
jgi:hypothetical protein